MGATHFKKKATMFGITPQNSENPLQNSQRNSYTGSGTLQRKLKKLKGFKYTYINIIKSMEV